MALNDCVEPAQPLLRMGDYELKEGAWNNPAPTEGLPGKQLAGYWAALLADHRRMIEVRDSTDANSDDARQFRYERKLEIKLVESIAECLHRILAPDARFLCDWRCTHVAWGATPAQVKRFLDSVDYTLADNERRRDGDCLSQYALDRREESEILRGWRSAFARSLGPSYPPAGVEIPLPPELPPLPQWKPLPERPDPARGARPQRSVSPKREEPAAKITQLVLVQEPVFALPDPPPYKPERIPPELMPDLPQREFSSADPPALVAHREHWSVRLILPAMAGFAAAGVAYTWPRLMLEPGLVERLKGIALVGLFSGFGGLAAVGLVIHGVAAVVRGARLSSRASQSSRGHS